jgi:hypothetical protein
MGGKDNWRCRPHSRRRSPSCFKGCGSAVDLVGGDACRQRQNLINWVESVHIKFDVKGAGRTDTFPNQIPTLSAIIWLKV